MIAGTWITALINTSVSNTLSNAVNLGRAYEQMMIAIPTITNAQISVQVAENAAATFQDLYLTSMSDADDDQPITTAGEGGITWVVPIGGAQYIKIKSSAAQGSNRTIRVRGIRS